MTASYKSWPYTSLQWVLRGPITERLISEGANVCDKPEQKNASKQAKQKCAVFLDIFLLELVLCSFIIHDVFAPFLSADDYTVGEQQKISLEIKPTNHTGLLLSSWNHGDRPDYIVLEMFRGNVSRLICRCNAFQLGLVQ